MKKLLSHDFVKYRTIANGKKTAGADLMVTQTQLRRRARFAIPG